MLVCIVNDCCIWKPKAEGTCNEMWVDANRVQINVVKPYLQCDVFSKDNIQISIEKAKTRYEGHLLTIKGYINQVKQL